MLDYAATWTVEVGDDAYSVVVLTPPHLAARPALLLHLTLDAHSGLEQVPHASVPHDFLAAGHRVAAFDLPNHGQRIDGYGAGLTGMATALQDGHDVVADLVATGRAVIDVAQDRLSDDLGPIVICGISRGGFYALHLLAADDRIRAAAVFAPVTNLLAVREFAGLEQVELIRRLNSINLVNSLATRPVYAAINDADDRVSTSDCATLFDAFRQKEPTPCHHLRLDPGATHTVTDAAYREGANWLLAQVAALTAKPA